MTKTTTTPTLTSLATPLLLMTSAGIMSGIVASYVMGVSLYGGNSLIKGALRNRQTPPKSN